MMDKEEYNNKLMSLLNNPTYNKLEKDPTERIEKKVSQALKEAEIGGWMFKRDYILFHSIPHHLVSMDYQRFTRSEPPSGK